jgi:hypothetical protein
MEFYLLIFISTNDYSVNKLNFFFHDMFRNAGALSSIRQIILEGNRLFSAVQQSSRLVYNGFSETNKPNCSVKADSHIACRAHAISLPCRAAKGLGCVFPI